MATRRTSVALDHNFPDALLRTLAGYLPEADLQPLRTIDTRLITLDDDALVVALRQLGIGVLVTNDRMLRDAATLVAIEQARMTLFAIEGVGDDPIRATGALLLDLPAALRKLAPDRPQIFRSRPRAPAPEEPRTFLERLTRSSGRSVEDLRAAYGRSFAELQSSILSEAPADRSDQT